MTAELVAVVLDALPLQIRQGHHHNLLTRTLFMGLEHIVELAAAGAVEQAGVVHHPPAQRREAEFGTQRRGEQQRQQQRELEQAHQNFTSGALSASALVASKFSRIGISLYITLCQMRPGKVRISVL
uniref:Uncharacterized protein n=1 Tax=Pseudomonas fluorescens TaxID=294 RepID=A0A5E6QKF5_PSEFL|nr:hypothetical protein PS652_01025 [Pseudomonas fluorescens]